MKFFVKLGDFSLLLLLASVADGGPSKHDPFFCYSTDTVRSMTQKMGYMTSYEAIRRINFTPVNPYIPNGTPSRFWYLGREGARIPHQGILQGMFNFAALSVQNDIVRNFEAGRTSLCRLDFEAIRDFNFDKYDELTMDNAFMVIESGVIAMQNIARRFQQTFPNILTQNYSPNRFHFRHTSNEWTNVSIRAFARGLFGEAGSQDVIYEDVPSFDWFLRSADFCPAFSQEIADSAAHQRAFTVGPEIEEMVEQVNRKLGFHTSNQLSVNTILNMWSWCRFETYEPFERSNSETGGNATWCAALSLAHHNLVQYRADLGHFYRHGYGVRNQRLLQNLSCGLIQDLLAHMQSNNTDQIARIFVSRSEEFMNMFSLLGAFRDTWPLHQHNFAQHSDRRYLTSVIGSFGANLAVVRYDSDDGDHDLIFLLNEKPMLVPGCDQQTGVCKLSVLVNRFQRFVNANCEVHFCSNE